MSVFTYLSPYDQHEHCSLTALDFAHKLRQYFYGSHDFCKIPQILDTFKETHSEENLGLLRQVFTSIDSILTSIEQVHLRLDEMHTQMDRLRDITLSKKRIKEMKKDKCDVVE